MFSPLVQALGNLDLVTHVATLPSTGTSSPGNPTMTDNIASIHDQMTKVVDEAGSDGVIAFFHSAGGAMGSGAMQGLSWKARKENGEVGGVRKIIFLAGLIVAEGDAKDSVWDPPVPSFRCRSGA
jgi:hypothetical protein